MQVSDSTRRVISKTLAFVGVLWLIFSAFMFDGAVDKAKGIFDSEMWIGRMIRNGLIFLIVLFLLVTGNIILHLRHKYRFAIVFGIAVICWTVFSFFFLDDILPVNP